MGSIEMCSTPSGIEASNGPNTGGDHGVIGAQRLPASRRATATDRGCCACCGRSAQRLPASRRATEDIFLVSPVEQLCSTPSGITASGGPCPATRSSTTAAFAQRLPASRRAAGPPRRAPLPRGTVLNAFRHHGERRSPRTRSPSSRCSSAQRLPASRRAAAGSGLRSGTARCAQRLPASRRAAERTRRVRVADAEVLNAFRHHGEQRPLALATDNHFLQCSAPSGITASGASSAGRSSGTWTPRAQRLPASRRAAGDPEKHFEPMCVHTCSTPSGIMASSGPARSIIERCILVLNAFRHHGERRRNDLESAGHPERCSTPSGISTRSGPWASRRSAAGTRAQRLPASRRATSAAGAGVEGAGPPAVLNAFRHLGEQRC